MSGAIAPMRGSRRSPAPLAWEGLDELAERLREQLGRWCADANDAEDVVQETLLRVAHRRAGLRDPERLYGWSLRIARNLWRDRLRSRARRPSLGESEVDLALLEAPSAGEDDLVLEGQAWEPERVHGWMRESLQRLREDDRSLLSDWSTGPSRLRELASRHGVEPAVLKVRLYRARSRLREVLARRLRAGAEERGARRC